jgi:LEA14-like dessication related protein
MRVTALFSAMVLGALISGCATTRAPDDLDITLVNVRLGDATVWETTAYFTVRISNARSEPLTVSGSAHGFYLNGLYVGQGLTGETIQVPRLSSATQEVTVHLRNLALATRIKPILEGGALEYRVQSTLYLGENSRSHRCRLAREGHLAMQDFQPTLRGDASRPPNK